MIRFDVATAGPLLARIPKFRGGGRLRSARGLLTSRMQAAVGDQCAILRPDGECVFAEVIGFADDTAYLLPYDRADSLQPDLPVLRLGRRLHIPAGPSTLGRVLDALGRPIDGKGPLIDCQPWPVSVSPPPPLKRARIRTPFVTGIRAIDGLLTCGRGQRVGIFAGSGVGKSTLLGEIAKGAESDVNVIALIGERGREVAPFIEDCLGETGLRRSTVLVATCEESPLMRVRAASSAVALADYYRASGANVLLLMDSMTRLAMAQREIGILLGEPPTSRGYTPSVFQLLAQIVESLGNSDQGGVTALLTVLVDGDDFEEPISDAVRSLVDGHIVLDRKIAERGRFPAIDVLRSVSRIASDLVDAEHRLAATRFRSILGTYAEVRDLVRIGVYVRGSSPAIDRACDLMPAIERFLRQDVNERSTWAATRKALLELTSGWTDP
ncbi:MAG: FliI/YscN family ATPase [Gemmataceae bacterium]|nr:FliI/YscN family ATPase [Gemmataceae bacterium]